MTHLVLTGLMGAGKTTVGELCAGRLDLPFVDTDRVIEAVEGMPVAEIFVSRGENRYRAIEEEVVGNALNEEEIQVISCGGGAVLSEATRKLMVERGFVVWLQADPDTLIARIGTDGNRPLLNSKPLEELTKMSAARERLYVEVARKTLDTANQTPDETASKVIDLYMEQS